MNDRDTQKAAAEDLLSIVVNMDQEGLPIILSALCTTGSEHKVYARKECARAIGIIASEACPLREQALQQPHLGKMLVQLRKSLQDADSSVREASSEALALVAQGLSLLAGGAGQGSLGNPVVKLIFDCLVEQKKELNAAACAALGWAAPYLGTLDSSLARELVRKLNSPAFQASAALLSAFARTDTVTGEPVGLLKSGPAAFVPLLPALVGQPAQSSVAASSSSSLGGSAGSGVAGALFRSDWQVRLAAADMLRATGMLLGPLMEMEGCWSATDPKSVTGRAIRGLEACRFDKVRDVRDVARSALTVLEELQAYGSQGGSAAGWPAHIAARLYGKEPPPLSANPSKGTAAAPQVAADPVFMPAAAGRNKSPVRRNVSPSRRPRTAQPRASHSPPPRRSPTPPERRSSPVFTRTGSLSERFRAAHGEGDVVAVRYPGAFESGSVRGEAAEGPEQEGSGGAGRQAEEAAATERPPPAQAWPPNDIAPDAAATSRGVSRQPSKAPSRASRAAEAPPLAVQPLFTVRSQREPRQPQPADGSSGGTAEGAARMMEGLGLGNDTQALLDSGGPPTFSRPWQEPGTDNAGVRDSLPAVLVPAVLEALAALPPDPGAFPVASTSAPPPLPSAASPGPTVTVPTAEWLAMQQRLRDLEAQNKQLLDSLNSLSRHGSQDRAALEARVRGLEAALAAAQPQPAAPSAPQPLSVPGPEAGPDSELAWLSRTIRPGSPLMPPSSVAAAAAAGPEAPLAAPPLGAAALQDPAAVEAAVGGLTPAADVRQAYREALSSGRLSDMHLLRLMQRTGPVWHELGQELATQLLACFTGSLQLARADGPMLSRVMPWLWRLADEENNRFVTPEDMRAPLLAALAAAQSSVTDPSLYERVALLMSTLRTHWSLTDPTRSSAAQCIPAGYQPSPLAPQPVARTASPSPLSYPGAAPAAQAAAALDGGQAAAPAWQPGGVGGVGVRASIATPASAAPASNDPPGGAEGLGAAALLPVPWSDSPGLDAPVAPIVTPRVPAVRGSYAGRNPSISTLMGHFSDLQRDFAAMSSPAAKVPARGQ